MTTTIQKSEWICTDPDCGQFGRQLTATVFEFKQEGVGPTLINLFQYTIEQKESALNSFGYTLKPLVEGNVTDLFGGQDNWMIAECLFEEGLMN